MLVLQSGQLKCSDVHLLPMCETSVAYVELEVAWCACVSGAKGRWYV